MKKFVDLIEDLISENTIIKVIFSNSRNKANPILRVNIRPILIKGELNYQGEYHSKNKVLHKNFSAEEFLEESNRLIFEDFKQANIFSIDSVYEVFAGNVNSLKIKKVQNKKAMASKSSEFIDSNFLNSDESKGFERVILDHNKKKNHIIPEGEPCDFLIHLGVMRSDGSVNKSHYNKFRQINRFLEIVDDVVSALPKDRKLTLIDFGCGKAYLTFALYHYLHNKNNYDVEIIGLDLKEDVIEFCNKTAKILNYENLRFQLGDIAKFDEFENVDMVVTLHACDTATDFALIKAVKWGASVILSVPCCQHELFSQISNQENQAILKYGILKERFSSILTDSLRGLKLEEFGYNVTMLEFTSLTHTAKNIMIRAVLDKIELANIPDGDLDNKTSKKAKAEFDNLVTSWNVKPTIGLLK